MAEVPEAQPLDPAPELPAEPQPPQGESWNPLRTPVTYVILLLQIGVVVWAGYKQTTIGGAFDHFYLWLSNNHWTLDLEHLHKHPLSLLTCLVTETLLIQVVMNVVVWWSAGPLLERMLGKWRLIYLYVFTGLGCLAACDLLGHYFPGTFTVYQARSACRHAVIACISAPLGVMLAIEGVKKTLASGAFLWRVASIAFMYVIAVALARGSAQVGLDIAGIIVDMIGGMICGYPIALTLVRGPKKVIGYALCLFLMFVVGVETGIDAFFVARSDQAAFRQNNGDRGGTKGAVSGNEPHRAPEEAATPKPATLADDEQDPPKVAAKRKEATDLLDTFGPLPAPSGNPDDQGGARRLYQKLVSFEEHFNGAQDGSANLDVEIAELALLAGDLATAERRADESITSLSDRLTPLKAQGSIRARRIARLYGVMAICSMKKSPPDDVAASSQLESASQWDPNLIEVYYWRGKLGRGSSPEARKWLRLYVDRVGSAPTRPDWQKDRVTDAKTLLGGD